MIFFTPTSLENNESFTCINKSVESVKNNDISELNEFKNNKTSNSDESLQLLDTSCNIQAALNSIVYDETLNNNSINYTSTSLNNNVENVVLKSSINNCEVSLNDIDVTNENNISNVSSTSLSSYNHNNQSSFSTEPMQEVGASSNSNLKFSKTENTNNLPLFQNTKSNNELIMDIDQSNENEVLKNINKNSNVLENDEMSLNCIKNYMEKQSSQTDEISPIVSIEKHDDLIESNFQSNNSNSKETIKSTNFSKPVKLNMVTTEPYPKYTPTVEKALKKYENKQPKKDCIVM